MRGLDDPDVGQSLAPSTYPPVTPRSAARASTALRSAPIVGKRVRQAPVPTVCAPARVGRVSAVAVATGRSWRRRLRHVAGDSIQTMHLWPRRSNEAADDDRDDPGWCG